MKKILFAILLFAGVASAQVRFGDGQPVFSVPYPDGPVYSVAGAIISFCNSPANGVPCTNRATTYTSSTLGTACSTSTQIVLAGTNTCVGTADNYGNWGVWVPAGNYTYTITYPAGNSVGPYSVTLSSGGGGGGSPGGSIGQIQYNNSGAFGGFTMGGDCTLIQPNITCTKTNGTSFAPSATTDTTNATNITSGTLAGVRVAAILLNASGNGGVTGLLPNSSLANPSVTVNGQVCTLGSSCTITQSITVNGGSSLPAPVNIRNQTTPFAGLFINFSNPSLGNVEATLSGTATEALLPAATMFTDQNFTYGAHVANFNGASHTFPMKAGTAATIPATCTFTAGSAMETYLATDATAGQNLYFCTATNTWTQQLNTGGSVPGSNTQVIFNNSAVLGASANFTWASPYLSLGASGTTGGIKYVGATSGVVTVKSLDMAGTWTFKWPNSGGTSGYVLTTDGSGNTSWTNPSTGGTVTSIAFSSPLSGGTITTTGTVACATCTTSAASLTSHGVVVGAGSQAEATIAADTTTTHFLAATAGDPAFRALASGDIPANAANTSGNAATATALASAPTNCATGVPTIGIAASGNSNGCITNLANGTAATTQTTGDNTTKVATDAFVNSSITAAPFIPDSIGTLLGDIIGFSASTTPVIIHGPTGVNGVPQIPTETPSGGVAQQFAWAPVGTGPDVQTGTSYTIVATDRAQRVTFNNASPVAVTLPQPNTTGFATNFTFRACNLGVGSATLTPTSSTISYTNGAAYTSSAGSMVLTTGQCASIYSDNTNWFADTIVPTGGNTAGYYCLMAAGTTCTATVSALTSGGCLATDQNTAGTPNYANCSISGTTATVKAASSNSDTWTIVAVANGVPTFSLNQACEGVAVSSCNASASIPSGSGLFYVATSETSPSFTPTDPCSDTFSSAYQGGSGSGAEVTTYFTKTTCTISSGGTLSVASSANALTIYYFITTAATISDTAQNASPSSTTSYSSGATGSIAGTHDICFGAMAGLPGSPTFSVGSGFTIAPGTNNLASDGRTTFVEYELLTSGTCTATATASGSASGGIVAQNLKLQ